MATAQKIDFYPQYPSALSSDIVKKLLNDANPPAESNDAAARSSKRSKRLSASRLQPSTSDTAGIIRIAQEVIGQTSDPALKSLLLSIINDPSNLTIVQAPLSQISQTLKQVDDSETDPAIKALLAEASTAVAQAKAYIAEPSEKTQKSLISLLVEMIQNLLNLELTYTQNQAKQIDNTDAVSKKTLEAVTIADDNALQKTLDEEKEALDAKNESGWLKAIGIVLFVTCSAATLVFLGPVAFAFTVGLYTLQQSGGMDAIVNGIVKGLNIDTPAYRTLVKLVLCLAIAGAGAGLSSALDTSLANGVETAASSTTAAISSGAIADETGIEMTNFAETASETAVEETAASSSTSAASSSALAEDETGIEMTNFAATQPKNIVEETAATTAKTASAAGSAKAAFANLFAQALMQSNVATDLATAIVSTHTSDKNEITKESAWVAGAINLILGFVSMKFANMGATQSATGAIMLDKLSKAAQNSTGFAILNSIYKVARNPKVLGSVILAATAGSVYWECRQAKTDYERGDTIKQKGEVLGGQAQLGALTEMNNASMQMSTDNAKQKLKSLTAGNERWVELTQSTAYAAEILA